MSPTETQPLLARLGHGIAGSNLSAAASPVKLLKLLPVLALASICRGISMFARYSYYSNSTQPSDYKWFTIWVKMPGVTVRMELWSMFASLVVSFVSVGWWSTFGDRRGRKPVLFVSILGAVLVDFIWLSVANTYSQQDGISLGLIVEGLLGGFATFNGVVHAYAYDLSPSPLSRTVIFGAIQAVSFTFFRVGAFVGLLSGPSVPFLRRRSMDYIISVVLGCCNLVYVYCLLPESLAPPQNIQPPAQKSLLKHILTPFSIFLRRTPSRKAIILLAFSVYVYSWTLGFGVKMAVFTTDKGYFAAVPRSLLLLAPSIINLLTWLCAIPALAFILQRAHGDTESSGRLLSKSLAQNSILLAALCLIGALIFGGARSSPLYALFFLAYPLSAGALPALYALAASYFLALGRGAEIGALFGALAMWVSLGEYVSYANLGDSEWSLDYRLEWTATFLVVSLLLLVPDGPPVQPDGAGDQREEHV
ncbi:hypothetical protein DFH09DRAFT_1355705 [Mycena vulgaris]|nr:hypothetical protein DFH09DRAFT_1355705 [Mycena vulgaris]